MFIGGIITIVEDLANYAALVAKALSVEIHPDLTAFSPPLPSGGVVNLACLKILDGRYRILIKWIFSLNAKFRVFPNYLLFAREKIRVNMN